MWWKSICKTIFLGLILWQHAAAQDKDPNTGYFLVGEERFDPPDSAFIADFIGKKAMAFRAKDMRQNEQYLGDHLDTPTLLWFWKTPCSLCVDILPGISAIHEEFVDAISLISFADDDRATLAEFLQNHPIDFPIIPNAGIFGEGAYAKDLGYPRLFFIDTQGKISKVLPETFFRDENTSLEDVRAFIRAQIN